MQHKTKTNRVEPKAKPEQHVGKCYVTKLQKNCCLQRKNERADRQGAGK